MNRLVFVAVISLLSFACGSSVRTTLETPGPVGKTITHTVKVENNKTTTESGTEASMSETVDKTEIVLTRAMAEFELKAMEIEKEDLVLAMAKRCQTVNPPTWCRDTRYGMYVGGSTCVGCQPARPEPPKREPRCCRPGTRPAGSSKP